MSSRADSTDKKIGAKIKERRRLVGFSPQQFASHLGISYQQLYKYESGINRVSSARLGKIARLLNVELDYFFNEQHAYSYQLTNDGFNAARLVEDADTSKLVKNYIGIADPRTRSALVELVTSVKKYVSKRTA